MNTSDSPSPRRLSRRGALALAAPALLAAVALGCSRGRAPAPAKPTAAPRTATAVVITNATPETLDQSAATAAAVARIVGNASPERPIGAVLGPTPAAGATPAGSSRRPTSIAVVQPTWELIRVDEKPLSAKLVSVDQALSELYFKKIEEAIRDGANLVITVGADLQADTAAAAEMNPNVKFIGVDQYQDRTINNLIGLIYNDDRGGFLAGSLAGMVTKSNIVGALLGPGWLITMINLGEGFASGGEYVNPSVEVLLEYHPGELPEAYDDAQWARETTQLMIDDGADVIFAAGGKTARRVLEVAKSKGLPTIGAEVDFYNAAPSVRGTLLTSVVKVVRTDAISGLIAGLADGSIRGGNVVGEYEMAPMREAEAQVPKQMRDRLTTIEQGLRQGSIKTGVQTR